MTENKPPVNESHTARISRTIAFLLIGIYGVSLAIIGIVAALKSSPGDEPWLELFKSGFLILGGGLTTVVGYYFGSRGVQEAQTSADEARKGREEEEAKRKKLEVSLRPTYDEDSLISPEETTGRGE